MSTKGRPSSLDGIKRFAKQIARDRGVKHHRALDEAAILAGYQNFAHAQRALANQPTPPTAAPPPPPQPKPDALQEFHKLARAKWIAAVDAINPSQAASMSWAGCDAIAHALRGFIGPGGNHAHLPSGGGLDYETMAFSRELECLEFGVGGSSVHIAKPERLTLERIDQAPAQSFLLLELGQLAPSGAYEPSDDDDGNKRLRVLRRDHEELLEADGEYFNRSLWDQGFMGHDERGREIPIPKNRRVVSRWRRGKILFVTKGSLWNGTPSTYDGRHNRMSPVEIRAMIERSLAAAA